MNKQSNLTPLMQQYYEIKDQFADALVLFQVGDFYELFFDDAQKASSFLGITLTTRGKHLNEPIPLCGVPVHTKDHYIAKLVKGGFKVALCDQLESPQPGKIVARGITQVFTPGTLAESQLLDEKSASYLLSFFPLQRYWGVLFGELLTAQLFATTISSESYKTLDAELVRFFPDEILIPNTHLGKPFRSYFSRQGFYTTIAVYDETEDNDEHAWIQHLKGFQEAEGNNDVIHHALRSFYRYIRKNQENALSEFTTINLYNAEDFLGMDASTQRHLELVKNNQDGTRSNTLFSLLDKAATSMGSRMIKKWLVRPLIKKESIIKRQDVVAFVIRQATFTQQLYQLLRSIGDIERVVGRIAIKRGSKHDYVQLGKSLQQFSVLIVLLQEKNVPAIMQVCFEYCKGFKNLLQLLEASLNDNFEKPWVIKPDFDKRLDELRLLVSDSNILMASLERKERERTGIGSLKIRYNSIHGYYIEVTKPNIHLVPSDYVRYQTLVGKERFTMSTLKEIEHKIITAEQTIAQVEQEIFEQIKAQVARYIPSLRKATYAIAHVDALLSFGLIAYNNNYVRPHFTDDRTLIIKEGRHPVVEQKLGTRFIPNDVVLNDEQSLWIITGPNMGGKSTFLRQTALISIMAQCGSFVPSQLAQLPLFDAIFTRIGARDNVAEGKSTFLVEMEETAHICSNATKNSLLILDEIGRGTSTFDGLAIAQAVVEYIHTNIQAHCLFATHYHELTALQQQFPGICSYYAASRKTQQGILLLYKILQGVADGSFGLEVAKLAQLPSAIVNRAHEVIVSLNNGNVQQPSVTTSKVTNQSHNNKYLERTVQILQCEVAEYKEHLSKLSSIDMEQITPRQAFDLLWSIKE